MNLIRAMRGMFEDLSRVIGWMIGWVGIATWVGLIGWPIFYRPEWTNSQILRNMWPYYLASALVCIFGYWLYTRKEEHAKADKDA